MNEEENRNESESWLLDYKCTNMYYVFFVVVVIITCYWIYLHNIDKNPVEFDLLNRKLFSIDILGNCCSGWALSHLIFFFMLGWIFPECGKDAMIMGILWEGVEMMLSKATETPRQAMKVGEGKYEYSQWWGGSFKDIIINAIGFYSAKTIKEYMDSRKANEKIQSVDQ